MKFFDTISVEEAKNRIVENIKDYYLEGEYVKTEEAKNRILYEDIISIENIPEFRRSTVDGYALKSKDSQGASSSIPTILKLKEEIKMGKVSQEEIKSGELSYVPTGGMLPEGSDSVVMVEYIEKLDGETVLVYKPVSNGENIIDIGEDIKKGSIVFKKGEILDSYKIGVLASLGIYKIKVFKKIKVSIISTGDEIIDIKQKISLGKIRDINSYVLGSLVEESDGIVVNKMVIGDDYSLLKNSVEEGLNTSDIVIISGGSSVGVKDYTYDIINSFDDKGVFIHGISIKPGKPTIVGKAKEKMIFGLPGHPVSATIVFNIFVKYAINSIRGTNNLNKVSYCLMDRNFPSSPGKKTYQTVKVYENNGDIYATPIFGKSGSMTLISGSDGYIEIEGNEEGIYKGERRKVVYF